MGETTFVHANHWIARVGPDRRLTDRFDTSSPYVREPAPWSVRDNEVEALVGFEPGPKVALVHRGMRGASFIGTALLKRTADGWADNALFGADGYMRQAWPWYDNSILVLGKRRWAGKGKTNIGAWSGTHEYALRLGVALGAPKAPHLSTFKTAASNCPIGVWSVAVAPRGDVVAIVGCRVRKKAQDHGVWVMRWFQDLVGQTTKLSERDLEGGKIVIGPGGETWVAIAQADGSEAEFFALNEARWTPIAGPEGNVRTLEVDPTRRLWVATTRAVWRAADREAAWVQAGPPGTTTVEALTGVEHGTPWVTADGQLWARYCPTWPRRLRSAVVSRSIRPTTRSICARGPWATIGAAPRSCSC